MSELEKRVDALERAVTDGDHDLSELAAEGEATERLAAVEERLDELDDRVAELEAATQALRGYVGNVRSVNRDVERRADAALATAEKLESAVTGDTQAETTREETPLDGVSDTEAETDTQGETPLDGVGDTAARTNGAATRSDGPATRAEAPNVGTGDADASASSLGTTSTGVEQAAAATKTTAEGNEHRCQACGRPTTREDSTDRSSASDGRQNGTAGSALDGTFRASGEDDERGPFTRIREML